MSDVIYVYLLTINFYLANNNTYNIITFRGSGKSDLGIFYNSSHVVVVGDRYSMDRMYFIAIQHVETRLLTGKSDELEKNLKQQVHVIHYL